MAFNGRKPRADRAEVRHRNPVLGVVEIPDVPFDGPGLPPRFETRGGVESEFPWPRDTIRWWGKIRTMPHAKLWSPTDWEYAFTTAKLHARIVEGKGSFVELRAREKAMMTTLEARENNRIRYVSAAKIAEREQAGHKPVAEPSPVARIDDYREMYG